MVEEKDVEVLENFGGKHSSTKHPTRKVQYKQGYPRINLPMSIIKSFGLMKTFLQGKLYIEVVSSNPLSNEIRIKFSAQKSLSKELPKSSCDSHTNE